MRRTYAYLHLNRCIDRDVLDSFIHNKMIYEDDEFHNAVFVVYDAKGKSRYFHKCGTLPNSTFKGNVSGSFPEYSFHWNEKSSKIFLFESPIDVLSFICMHKEHWQDHTYAASCSVSDRVLFQCIKDNPNLKPCIFILIMIIGESVPMSELKKLNEMEMESYILVPYHKDWNQDCLNQDERSEQLCCNKVSAHWLLQ